jgi:hypothetical protein
LVSRQSYNPTRLTEVAIDQAFAKMADDADYQRDSISLAREFETSDWQALRPT